MIYQKNALTIIPPSYKYGFLLFLSILVYAIPQVPIQVVLLIVSLITIFLTSVSVKIFKSIISILFLITLVCITTGFVISWHLALLDGMRILTVSLFAYAVSTSTNFQEMLSFFEQILKPTRHIGINVAHVSLALALTIRFIPELRNIYFDIREAQYARGLHNRPIAVLLPLVIRVLQKTEEISESLDARLFDAKTNTNEVEQIY